MGFIKSRFSEDNNMYHTEIIQKSGLLMFIDFVKSIRCYFLELYFYNFGNSINTFPNGIKFCVIQNELYLIILPK